MREELGRARSAALISPLDPRAPTDLFGQAHIFNDRSPGQQSRILRSALPRSGGAHAVERPEERRSLDGLWRGGRATDDGAVKRAPLG